MPPLFEAPMSVDPIRCRKPIGEDTGRPGLGMGREADWADRW
jgi:hypothetical protein